MYYLVGLLVIPCVTVTPLLAGACPGGGGGGRRGLPPPLEIEKQKKKGIRANFKLFHPHFATFLVENVIFSASF